MDRGAWRATVHRVKKSQTWLSDEHIHVTFSLVRGKWSFLQSLWITSRQVFDLLVRRFWLHFCNEVSPIFHSASSHWTSAMYQARRPQSWIELVSAIREFASWNMSLNSSSRLSLLSRHLSPRKASLQLCDSCLSSVSVHHWWLSESRDYLLLIHVTFLVPNKTSDTSRLMLGRAVLAQSPCPPRISECDIIWK